MVKLLPTKTPRTSRSLESNWEACRERCRMTVFCSSALKGGHVWWGPERSYCMGPLEIGWGYGAPKTKEGSYEPLCTKKLVGAHLVPKDWNWVGRSFAKQNRPNNFEEFREVREKQRKLPRDEGATTRDSSKVPPCSTCFLVLYGVGRTRACKAGFLWHLPFLI